MVTVSVSCVLRVVDLPLWLKAMLKLDFLFCCLLIAAGIAFFFEHLEPIERVFMAP